MQRGLFEKVMELNAAASLGRTPGELEAAMSEADRVLRGRKMREMERKGERAVAAAAAAEMQAAAAAKLQAEFDNERLDAGLPTAAQLKTQKMLEDSETQRILEEMEGLLSDDASDDGKPISQRGCFATLRGCFGRNKGTRRNHPTREDSHAFADGGGGRRIARRTRSKARHNRRQTRRSKTRRSKTRRSKTRRSKTRRSKTRRSKTRRSKTRRSKTRRRKR